VYPSNTSGAVGDNILVWGAQLELGSTATPYQSRVTINDVTEAGVPDTWFTVYDGTSDRLEGDAAMRDIFRDCDAGFVACVVEHDALNDGYIWSFSTGDSTSNQRADGYAESDGTLHLGARRDDDDALSSTETSAGVITTGSKQIVMGVYNWTAGTVEAYVGNSVTPAATGTMPAGTGPSEDTASDAVFIGAQSDASDFFDGRLHGPIVIGRIAPSAAQRQAIFQRLSSITGAPLS
jgi:hypothetical protein